MRNDKWKMENGKWKMIIPERVSNSPLSFFIEGLHSIDKPLAY